MPAIFLSTSVAMMDRVQDRRWILPWGFAASVVLHLLAAALLVFELPVPLPQPQEEEAIKVDLVPPPKPPEKAKAEPPPPVEKPKPEKPRQEPEKPEQAKAEPPPAVSKDTASRQPAPALRPVVQFGEKDAGPREALDGNSAEDGSSTPAASREPDEKELAEPPTVTAAGAAIQVPPPGTPGAKAPKAEEPAEAQKTPKLKEAKKLFSTNATGDLLATTAMGDIPRDVRVGELCGNEIRQQLLHASPPYLAERYPRYELKDGTVLQDRRAAFRAGGQWYDLSFRCEVDADATKVVSFAFGVGDLIPRSEWSRRKPPLQ